MDRAELEQVGVDLFGWGWQTSLAKGLGVDGRTVRRWGIDIAAPRYVEAILECLRALRDAGRPLPPRWTSIRERKVKMQVLRQLCRQAFSEYRVRGLDNIAEPKTIGKREALVIADALEAQGNVLAFKLSRAIREQAARC
jgi:hypothetical protein